MMNLFVAISIEAYKKLAIDNTTLMSNSAENQDTDSADSAPNPGSKVIYSTSSKIIK